MSKKTLAAIDLGTNSCRLLIADENGKYLYSDSTQVKLGEGMYEDMSFTDLAMKRGVDCFCAFRDKMAEFEVGNFRSIATAACRMAKNAPDFIAKVKEQSGIEIEVIDGEEEARLNLKGALVNADESKKYVVVYDLGGGSTEITLASNEENPQIFYTISIPWGARNATEAFSKDIELQKEIKAYVEDFIAQSGLKNLVDEVCFIGTSSTPLRLASMAKKMGKYEREKADGIVMSKQELDDVISGILAMTQPQMAESPYIGENRSHIFRAAMIISKEILDGLGCKELISSLKSAKDGIIEEMVKKYGKTN